MFFSNSDAGKQENYSPTPVMQAWLAVAICPMERRIPPCFFPTFSMLSCTLFLQKTFSVLKAITRGGRGIAAREPSQGKRSRARRMEGKDEKEELIRALVYQRWDWNIRSAIPGLN